MVEFLSPETIKLIHSYVEEQFPSVEHGIKDHGLIESAAERPTQRLYDSSEQFEDIFTKAASLMEAIIRWHPFIDGNKRTGLLSAFSFLYVNGHYLAIPLDSVKFTVKIADTREQDQETTSRLIKEISTWLKERSAKNLRDFNGKVIIFLYFPIIFLIVLNFFRFRKYVNRKLSDWFAIESHPEYAKEIGNVSNFLNSVMTDALKDLREKQRIEKQRKNIKKIQAAGYHRVSIPLGSDVPGCEENNACFLPYELKIKKGETVTWTNDDKSAHTISSGDPSNVNSIGTVFDSSLIKVGKTFSHKFKEEGLFDYFCIVHPWQKGSIIVE